MFQIDFNDVNDVYNVLTPCYITHYASPICHSYSNGDVTEIVINNNVARDGYALQFTAKDFPKEDRREVSVMTMGNVTLGNIGQALIEANEFNVTVSQFKVRFIGGSNEHDIQAMFHLELKGKTYTGKAWPRAYRVLQSHKFV